jgi:hypothetical protein
MNKLKGILICLLVLGSHSLWGGTKRERDEGNDWRSVEIAQQAFDLANQRVEELLRLGSEMGYRVQITLVDQPLVRVEYQGLLAEAIALQEMAQFDLMEHQALAEIELSEAKVRRKE